MKCRRSKRWIWLLALTLWCSACTVTLHSGRPTTVAHDALRVSDRRLAQCMRSLPGTDRPYREPLPARIEDPAVVSLLGTLPARVRRTAFAAGIEPLVARLLAARDAPPTPETLALRAQLDARIAALQPQMLASEFECECVIALVDRALAEHDRLEHEREMAFTIASLVTGAAFSLGAGVWDLVNNHLTDPPAPDGPLVTALVGAVITAGLGVAVLVSRPHEIVFVHEHNVLAPIVTGTDPTAIYPTFVFQMLTLPSTDEGPTARDELLARWVEIEAEGVPDERRALARELWFGEGGIYDAEVLETHRALLEELESALDAIARDVDELGRTLEERLDDLGPP